MGSRKLIYNYLFNWWSSLGVKMIFYSSLCLQWFGPAWWSPQVIHYRKSFKRTWIQEISDFPQSDFRAAVLSPWYVLFGSVVCCFLLLFISLLHSWWWPVLHTHPFCPPLEWAHLRLGGATLSADSQPPSPAPVCSSLSVCLLDISVLAPKFTDLSFFLTFLLNLLLGQSWSLKTLPHLYRQQLETTKP